MLKLKTYRNTLGTLLFCVFQLTSVVAPLPHKASNVDHQKEMNNLAIAGIIIVTCLVAVSIVFEMINEKLIEETDEMNMPFIHTIFSELTTLGFIGLLLFVVSKLQILESLSETYLGERKELQEKIEMLHMILFLFVVIFLILCCIFLRLGTLVQQEWRSFERRVMDIESVLTDYCQAYEDQQTWKGKLNPFSIKKFDRCQREMVYLSLRLRFLDSKCNHPDPAMLKSQTLKEYQHNGYMRFPFCEYLSIISGEVMGRLIEIDVRTWIALEFVLVFVFIIIWKLGEESERWIILICGFFLILMNQYVYVTIDNMREQLTPPMLFHRAETLRHKSSWRHKHGFPPIQPTEHSELLKKHSVTFDENTPPYVRHLPNFGRDMSKEALNKAQRALLNGSGNGVTLALFSTRLVFLLTAVHLSIFIVREAAHIYLEYSLSMTVFLYILYLLPSATVTIMSTRIARDGLYAFNVEHMKVPRVINKVTRLLKARQTLRTLRFIAEMKIYLKEEHCDIYAMEVEMSPRASSGVILSAQGEKIQNTSPLSESFPRSPTPTSLEMSSSTKKSLRKKKRHRKKNDPYELEQERREIHSIFCLFDVDGSGSITKNEMQSLLMSITRDISLEQIQSIMNELDQESTGAITFDEFYRWCHEHIEDSTHSSEDLIREVFKMVDTDDNGEITVEEFIEIFKTLGESLDHDDVRELVYQMDRNNDGRINIEEFSKMLRKHAI